MKRLGNYCELKETKKTHCGRGKGAAVKDIIEVTEVIMDFLDNIKLKSPGCDWFCRTMSMSILGNSS